jgi:hypothetical protein
MKCICLTTLLAFLLASVLYGSQKKTPRQYDGKKPPDMSQQWQSALLIKLKGSREQPTAGSDFGISADIENISDKDVYLNPQGLTMTAPPEVDANGPEDWPAFLPGPAVAVENGQSPTPWDRVVVLAPHSRMSAFWSGNLRKLQSKTAKRSRFDGLCEILGEDCSTIVNNIAFPPGKYTITVVGSYWDSADGAKNKDTQHRTETASTDLEIVAAQATVLLGAAIGGLLAFLLLPSLRPSRTSISTSYVLRTVGALFTSMLLSVVITILLARLSQSQFLVKVTVNDFWGAMTVGFIVSASGSTILRQFTTLGRGTTAAHSTGDAAGHSTAQPAPPSTSVPPAEPDRA